MASEVKALRDFAVLLAGEIRDREPGDARGAEYRENAFVEYVAELLEELGTIESSQICYLNNRLGGLPVRLNGYARSDEGDRLSLLTAVFIDAEEPCSVPASELSRAALQAARAVDAARRGLHEVLERSSERYSMMSAISAALEDGVKEVNVLVLTDGICSTKRSKPVVVKGVEFRVEVYDLRRLMRTATSGQSRDVIDIDFAELALEPIPCLMKPSGDHGCDVYMAIIPGEALFRLYNEFGSRLLEYNVRSFLQASGKVNRGIRDSLREEPYYFMAYNNGISVTVDDLSVGHSECGLVITRVKGLQIVNGGQTTASIHRARKRDGVDLSQVYVAAKITKLPPDQVDMMVPRISRYANTQNVIQEADFSSNEPFHIDLERLSETIWCPGERSRWFYERARGQYRTAMNLKGVTSAGQKTFKEQTPPAQKFNKTDVARFLNSWNQLPHLVSAGAQKNFVAFMRKLREDNSSWAPDERYFKILVAKAILFNAAARVVRKEGFPAYRANIVSYLIAYLSHRSGGKLDFDRIWHKQAISTEMELLLRLWSHDVARAIQDSAGGRNVTEWCKKEACWEYAKTLALTFPGKIPTELAAFIVQSE